MPKLNFILKFLTDCSDTQRTERLQLIEFYSCKIGWKRPGFSLKDTICARESVCGREKIDQFQKNPHCFRNWSKATVLRNKYSTWQYQAMEKHKGSLSSWPQQKVYSSIFFFMSLSYKCVSDNSTSLAETVWSSSRQKHKPGWVITSMSPI